MLNITDTTINDITIDAEDVWLNIRSGDPITDWDDADAATGKGTPTWEWAAEYAENVINWDGEAVITDEVVAAVVEIVKKWKAYDHETDD